MPNLDPWSKYTEGMLISWPFSFSDKDLKSFAELSGDFNPIHTDLNFAKSKGFDAPLVYGLLLSTQMSRLIGQELPDKDAILTSISIEFNRPCFAQDKLFFEAELVNKSDATCALEFKCNISRGGQILCRGIVNAIWRS
jgi:acyl dehydratase